MSHYSATLRLGVPIAIGQLGVIILGFADTLMVGRYSTDALAASAFVNNLFTLFTFLLMGYSYGLTPIVSALFGQGKQAEAGEQLKPGALRTSTWSTSANPTNSFPSSVPTSSSSSCR